MELYPLNTASRGNVSGSIFNKTARSIFILGFFKPFDHVLGFSSGWCFGSLGGTFGAIFGLPFSPFNRAFSFSIAESLLEVADSLEAIVLLR
jgi:hypothetical protein